MSVNQPTPNTETGIPESTLQAIVQAGKVGAALAAFAQQRQSLTRLAAWIPTTRILHPKKSQKIPLARMHFIALLHPPLVSGRSVAW